MIKVDVSQINVATGWIQDNSEGGTIQNVLLYDVNKESRVYLHFENFDLWLNSLKVFEVKQIRDCRGDKYAWRTITEILNEFEG